MHRRCLRRVARQAHHEHARERFPGARPLIQKWTQSRGRLWTRLGLADDFDERVEKSASSSSSPKSGRSSLRAVPRREGRTVRSAAAEYQAVEGCSYTSWIGQQPKRCLAPDPKRWRWNCIRQGGCSRLSGERRLHPRPAESRRNGGRGNELAAATRIVVPPVLSDFDIRSEPPSFPE